MYKIMEKTVVAHQINKFVIQASDISKKVLPGQFVILRLNEKGERIPITVAEKNIAEGTITLFIQEVGKTTKKIGELQSGDYILDVVGPLGIASDIEKFGTVICIAGGVGTAVIYPIAKALKEKGNEVITILGARSKDLIILEKEMNEISDKMYIATDDGSYGVKGFVSDILKKLISESGDASVANIIYAIGPIPMMKVVSGITKQYNIKTIVSLNPIMVDGTGMCGACRVTIGGVTKFTCVDGPDFDGHLVDWDELICRLSTFKCKEKEAIDHHCKLTK